MFYICRYCVFTWDGDYVLTTQCHLQQHQLVQLVYKLFYEQCNFSRYCIKHDDYSCVTFQDLTPNHGQEKTEKYREFILVHNSMVTTFSLKVLVPIHSLILHFFQTYGDFMMKMSHVQKALCVKFHAQTLCGLREIIEIHAWKLDIFTIIYYK